MKTIIITKTKASTGRNIERIDITSEVPVSTTEITGFAIPAVETVDVSRVAPEAPEMAAAVPPPAIIAKAHVISGLRSATVETMTAVPAIAAKGIAIESNRLSINGMK